MKNEEQNPQFEVWLARYGKRLIEVAQTCIVTKERPSQTQDQQVEGDSRTPSPQKTD